MLTVDCHTWPLSQKHGKLVYHQVRYFILLLQMMRAPAVYIFDLTQQKKKLIILIAANTLREISLTTVKHQMHMIKRPRFIITRHNRKPVINPDLLLKYFQYPISRIFEFTGCWPLNFHSKS